MVYGAGGAGWRPRLVALAVILAVLTGCAGKPDRRPAAPFVPTATAAHRAIVRMVTSTTVIPTPTAVPATPTLAPTETPPALAPLVTPTAPPPAIDLARAHPNELGEIPILEYHLIADQDGRWSRSWQHFQDDLDRLYRLGYRTVSLQDVIDDRIDVPAGTSPVVLTFDDSSPGQFTFVEQDGKLVPDPHCAVGILDAFVREHPDFGEHATFFVLPAAEPPHNLFGQNQYQKAKLDYLIAHGMDIGNHTYWHQNLATVSDAEVERQIGQAVQVIGTLEPGYEVDLFALPEGAWPRHKELAYQGNWNGIRYNNRAVLLVGASPASSPDRIGFDPLALPRIQAIPRQLDLWLGALDHGVHQRYVSDGDPNRVTFPIGLADRLKARPGEEKLRSPDPNYEVYRLR